jgi:hypothetical protein
VVALSLPSLRGRAAAVGLLAGVLAGSLGAAVARDPAPPPQVRARVLHAAPVLAVPGEPLRLRFASVCQPASSPACDIRSAVLHVRVDGLWRDVAGTVEAGEAEFLVPGQLVPEGGLAYYADLVPDRGSPITYPPSGAAHPVEVGSTAGFHEIRVPAGLSLDEVRDPDGTELFLPWGTGAGEVGLAASHPGEEALGPSSFAVGPDGSIYVSDWVNGRIQVFGAGGYRELPLPARTTVDIAVDARGRIDLTGLGMGARAWQLAPDGRRLGTFPIGLGAPTRIAATPDGPRVAIGPGQWVPAAGASGGPLTSTEQDRGRSSAIGQAASQDLAEDRVAVTWPSPDGQVGAVVVLPEGVRVGVEYFVQPLPDGGALLARALWDDTHTVVGAFRFSASGELLDLTLLPEPSTKMDARLSTVRFRPPGEVLLARDRTDGIAIERYEVMP